MKITCETKDTLPLSTLTEFQGGLKIRTNTDVDKIITSIKKYGFFAPFFVWKHDGINHVLDGHGRLTALKKIAKTESIPPLPVVYVDCNDEEDARNKLLRICSQYGKMTEESVLDFMGDFNFDFDELQLPDGILEIERPQDEEYTEEELEAIPEDVEPVCKLCDIWELGEHRLICGDSTEEEVYTNLMGGGMADLLLTDPPYNVDYEGKEKSLLKARPNDRVKKGIKTKIENDKMTDINFYQFLLTFYKSVEHFLKEGSPFYIWHADTEGENFRKALKKTSLTLRQCLVWVKNNFAIGRQDYHWRHEPCLYGWKEGASHYFIDDRTQSTVIEDTGIDFKKLKKDEAIKMLIDLHSDKLSTTVIREDKPARNAEHPTMKPIRLLARLIRNSSKIDDVVLDPFGGSGSTLIACEQLNRKCRMIELDPKYCDVIIARWEQLTGKQAKKLGKPCKEDAIGS